MPSYRAIVPIDHGRVRAYNVGDPVPAANVEANGYVVGEQVEDIDAAESTKPADTPETGEPDTKPAIEEAPATADPATPLQAEAPAAAGKRLPKSAQPTP